MLSGITAHFLTQVKFMAQQDDSSKEKNDDASFKDFDGLEFANKSDGWDKIEISNKDYRVPDEDGSNETGELSKISEDAVDESDDTAESTVMNDIHFPYETTVVKNADGSTTITDTGMLNILQMKTGTRVRTEYPDGSSNETTNYDNGTKRVKTKAADGSGTDTIYLEGGTMWYKCESRADGSSTQTFYEEDGVTVKQKTEYRADGSHTVTKYSADGSYTRTEYSANGEVVCEEGWSDN